MSLSLLCGSSICRFFGDLLDCREAYDNSIIDHSSYHLQKGNQLVMNLRRNGIITAMCLSMGIVSTSLLLGGCSSRSPYTKEQAMVKYGYESIKDNLLDPESMIVYDCYSWSSKSEERSMERMQQPG